jgi:signal transduction histidine kinase
MEQRKEVDSSQIKYLKEIVNQIDILIDKIKLESTEKLLDNKNNIAVVALINQCLIYESSRLGNTRKIINLINSFDGEGETEDLKDVYNILVQMDIGKLLVIVSGVESILMGIRAEKLYEIDEEIESDSLGGSEIIANQKLFEQLLFLKDDGVKLKLLISNSITQANVRNLVDLSMADEYGFRANDVHIIYKKTTQLFRNLRYLVENFRVYSEETNDAINYLTDEFIDRQSTDWDYDSFLSVGDQYQESAKQIYKRIKSEVPDIDESKIRDQVRKQLDGTHDADSPENNMVYIFTDKPESLIPDIIYNNDINTPFSESIKWDISLLDTLSQNLYNLIQYVDVGIGIVKPEYRIDQLEKDVEKGNINYIELKQSQGFDWARKVAHEIGGPIETVRDNVRLIQNYLTEKDLLAESLLEGSEDEKFKIKSTVERILNSTKVITNIVKGVSEHGKLTPPNKTAICAEDFQRIFKDLFDQIIINKDVKLCFEIDDCTLIVDKSLFIQVFKNLFENTKKYGFDGFEGKKEIYISMKCEEKTKMFVLKYSNSGNPVKCTENDYWEQFKTEDKQKGSGLGMSIVKEIIDSHGGTAKLEPESFTSGHTLTLTIPMKEESE